MGINRARKISSRLRSEAGQTMLIVVLALSFFLLGIIAFAVDMAHVWYHRQTAQTAADAACTAGIMDMLVKANGGTPPSAGFTPGTAFSCSGSPTAAPCKYAAKNGYNASTLVAGKAGVDLNFSFPTAVSGLPDCKTGKGAPPVCNASSFTTNPFLQVNVTDRVPTFFAGLLNGSRTLDVGAKATCALAFSNAPIPLLILDPRNETSLTGNGNIQISIVGGPQRSIQVNSSSSTAVSISGASNTIDLSQGGPDNKGSDFGVTGQEPKPGNVNALFGSQGQWLDPVGAISDPFATTPAPSVPGAPQVPADLKPPSGTCLVIPCHVTPLTLPNNHGCQDATNGCEVYTAGLYTTANAIQTFKKVLLFDPGVYYLQSDLAGDQQTCLRPGTGTGDGSGGTMFYFSGTHTLKIGANSGRYGVCGTTAVKVPLNVVRCINSGPGTTTLPANVVTNGGLSGNVLLGPCQAPTAGGTNYGDPLGVDDPLGEQRGLLFFQDRSANLAAAGNQPSWGGGGTFGLTGIMYFHYCNSTDGAGLGSNCNSGAYTDQLSLQGGSASDTFVVGDIVIDKLSLGGNPKIEMDLNPNALFYELKATLIQ